MAQRTRAQLTTEVNDLSAALQAANSAHATEAAAQAAALITLQEAMARQAEELASARAEAEAQATAAAEAQAAVHAQAAAAAQAQAPADPAPGELIPKPSTARYNIRDAMQLSYQDFLTVRATIHNLVRSTQLKWREDFRRQDPAQLSILFKAARKEHPVLKRYINNWATAVIAKTYMQNMRKHARKQGYIPAWRGGRTGSD